MILVDTSVLVDFLRGRPTEGAESLHRLEQDGVPFAIPAICCQELLAGARDEDEWRLLLDYLETQDVVTPADPWHTHVEAARIMFDCRARGTTVRGAIDCLIGQLALENDAPLLHSDRDFDIIATVRPLRAWR